ncbi:MAG: type I methionyl aminopeptidase [Patescibacteria group bacterium]
MSIQVKTTAQIAIMAEGGRRLIKVLAQVKKHLAPGISLKNLDQIAREETAKLDGQPSFLGYRGYPAAMCTSVNYGIVHCIPDDYELQEGDLISVDFGVLYQGWHTDAAVTWIVGKDINNYLPLLKGVYRALLAGTAAVRAGVTVGEISQALETSLRQSKLTTMRQFVGHGVGRDLHEDPVIPNFVGHDKKVVLPAGSTIAIEPIAGLGREEFFTLKDHWSVHTTDQEPVAHFEQTLAVLPEGSQILTPIQEILDFTP